MNYFELFSLKAEFDIDLKKLEKAYKEQVLRFHPDKFTTKSNKEKSTALKNTSLINSAFDILKSELKRANYLLELSAINAFSAKDTKMDADFLLEQIELREELAVIKDELSLDNFIEKIKTKIKDNITNISAKFKDNDLENVKNLVRELKFYSQLENQAKQLMDEIL